MSKRIIGPSTCLVLALMATSLAAGASGARSQDPRSGKQMDGLRRALRSGAIDRDAYVVERAGALFNGARARRQFGPGSRPDPRSATTVLRDLAVRLPRLDGAERRRARRILARPTDGASDPQHQGYDVPAGDVESICSPEQTNAGGSINICVHWVNVPGNGDAPDLADNDTNFIPDYVETVRSTFHDVWETEITDYGYKAPLPDGSRPNHGPDSGIDIYLADVGDEGIYGYCANDKPQKGTRSQTAYCVLDNDFSQADYEPGTYGLDALQVTAAHEFFHAIQFAYDWKERRFFMEGTAVWMEDEVYDHINANYAYLHDSPLHQPEIPLDAGDTRVGENFEYGSWLFWRFLSEKFSPQLIRKTWASAATEDVFPALSRQLKKFNSNLSDAFSRFAEWNRTINPPNTGLAFYEEGVDYMGSVANRYPPWDAEFWLGPGRTASGDRRLPLDHLSTRYVIFRPLTSITDLNAKLKMSLDLPKTSLGPRARLLVLSGSWVTDGDYCTSTYSVRLNKEGNGSRTVPFRTIDCGGQDKDVLSVTIAFTNGGFKDDLVYKYKGVVQ